uniref:ATP binding protein n=1 Tax=Arundo donax TaxID=35708 RepID=A0A0A9GP17_ARUDO
MDLVVWKVYNEVPDSDDDETSAANPNPNPAVGKAVLSLDPLRSDEQPLQLKMEMAQADNVNTPKSYSLNISEEFVPMSAFSESTKGKLTCEGMTKNKFDMEPHKENLADYGKLCHERTRKSMIKARKVQVLENDHGISAGPMSGMVGLAPSGSKENKKPKLTAKPSDVKRTPMDSRELENIQYKLFDRQPNGPLKQLKQEPDQPEQLLKEIQNDTCVYNKGGPNQGNA